MMFQEGLAFSKLQIQNNCLKKHRFPLLKLPIVILLECIENLDVWEVILFSLLSKRAKTIAKLIRWSPLDICFRFNRTLQICLKLSTDPDKNWIINYKTEEKYRHYLFKMNDPKALHYFVLNDNGNAAEDSKQMVEHICEVFRSPICDFHIFDKSFIEWIIKFQPIIRNVLIPNYVVTSIETLDRILKNLKATELFHLQSISIDEKFQITEPIPSRSIIIWDSFWITLPVILNGNNVNIRLFGSKLTPMDTNTILKEWQKGTKLQNLEFLGINISTTLYLDRFSDEVSKGLNLKELVGNDGRPSTIKIGAEWTYTPQEEDFKCNLIRNDGMIGSMFYYYAGSDGQKNNIRFMFQVWRRQT